MRPKAKQVPVSIVIVSDNPDFGFLVANSLSRHYSGIRFVFDARRKRRFHRRGWAIRWLLLDGTDETDAALVATIAQVTRKSAETVVIPADSAAMSAVDRIKAELSCCVFPACPIDSILQFDDKGAFAHFCSRAGVDMAETIELVDKHAVPFDSLAAGLALPFVIKPANKHGGEGFRLIHSRSEFERVGADKAYVYSPMVAQQFIPGSDVDISLLAVAGAIKHISVQICAGQSITFIDDESAVAMARQIVSAGNFSGLLHLDGRRDNRDNEIKLIEANPRPWASMAASTWCGLDFIEAGIDVALGRPTSQPATPVEKAYPGFFLVLWELATGRRKWTRLTPHQRGLLRSRLLDVGYFRALAVRYARRALAAVRSNGAPR